jgi:NADPH-dependent ferric siderophore reductase
MADTSSTAHTITRVAHTLRFRRLVVRSVEVLTPRMRRIVFGGDDLDGFTTLAFDDHVKLFFPGAGQDLPTAVVSGNGLAFPQDGAPVPAGRDFTPRRWDPHRAELTIDFGLHGHGPATAWASTAVPGAAIGAGGPRSSSIVSDAFDWNLLVGDETALPAISRRLDESSSGVRVVAVIQVEDAADQLPLAGHTTPDIHWVHRHGGMSVDDVVAGLVLPAGEGFAWVAGESSLARRIRRHLIDVRQLDKANVKASAYWSAGVIGRHEVIAD